MAAEEAEAPGLPEDEVRGGCGPLGGPPSRRGRPVIRARARPLALERDTRGGRGGERRARGGCGEQVPADQGHRPPWRPPGAPAAAWARADFRGGRGLGWGDIPGPSIPLLPQREPTELSDFPTKAFQRPGWERGEVGFLRLRGKCQMWGVHTLFQAFVRVFSKNEGKRSRNT